MKSKSAQLSKSIPPYSALAGWNFNTTYLSLPQDFFCLVKPTQVVAPQMVLFNEELAKTLGLNVAAFAEEDAAALFAGNLLPEGATTLAQAYAGHQFGYFTMLGDGRAILLGEQVTPENKRFDIQFKGSGQTPYSRRGDGRAALGPMLREYIISEAMAALGIPTTRSLAVVATGEAVYREKILPGAVLTRVADSHIRVGTFEFAAALAHHRGDISPLKALADYTIERHYPELLEKHDKYREFLRAVMVRQAKLIAQWMSVGFIHGVMNTDNMAISGETIDFGPCAFMDAYHPLTVFSSIDHHGRYAYGNQPSIAGWNLARFAETLLPLLAPTTAEALEMAQNEIAHFEELYEQEWLGLFRRKLGFTNEEAGDLSLVQEFLNNLEQSGGDFTNGFRALAYEAGLSDGENPIATPIGFSPSVQEFLNWKERWLARLERQPGGRRAGQELVLRTNPVIIPRNHKVEEALAAAEQGELYPLQRLLVVLRQPYLEIEENEPYRNPAPPSPIPYRTFCGT